jgi:hypothetical protein
MPVEIALLVTTLVTAASNLLLGIVKTLFESKGDINLCSKGVTKVNKNITIHSDNECSDDDDEYHLHVPSRRGSKDHHKHRKASKD